jgi:hypothetical protein
MEPIKIQLSGLWVALMLTYLLGDVLRIYAGDFEPGNIGGMEGTPAVWMAAAVMMLIPIVMVVLCLTLDRSASRWANIILAAVLLVFNAVGLPGYPGLYDKFLIAVGLVINLVTIVFAWRWV